MLRITEGQADQNRHTKQPLEAGNLLGEPKLLFGDPPHTQARYLASGAKASEVARLTWEELGYRVERYLCPKLPEDRVLQVLCHKHIVHAVRLPQGNGNASVNQEEHWLLHYLPDDERKVPSYVWKLIDLLKSHHIEPFWVWIAERVPVDDEPIVDPRPLFCISFDGHVIAL